METENDGCLTCSKPMDRETVKTKSKKYCSIICKSSASKKDPVSKECPNCKKPFEVIPGRYRFSVYCSFVCYRKYKVSPGRFVEGICKFCEKQFKFRQTAQRMTVDYCSPGCAKNG